MVNVRDRIFGALAHETRRDILARLTRGECSVGELADAYHMSLNAVSKHVKALEDAGLVSRRVDWRVHYISLNPEPLREAHQWLELYRAFWENRLDALEQFLARKKGLTAHGSRGPAQAKARRQRR